MAATRLASKSENLHNRAKKLIPGGVNSPVRAYTPYPLFVASAQGSRFRSVDGEEYLDYCMGYGALLDGHASTFIVEAVKSAIEKGSVYGQPTEQEVRLAEIVTSMVPAVEMVRLANTGTEATMHAIRLARGYTGREKILIFEGGFHGSHDSTLVKPSEKNGSVVGVPGSEGVPLASANNTLVARFNDQEMIDRIMQDHPGEIAALVIEPVMGNIGPITPKSGFLEALRKHTKQDGSLLVFDEVITGFRLAMGGAQEYYRVRPDITIFGKVLGGGYPISLFGGKREIMEKLAPMGKVYQAGTFNGNPISVSAAIAMLEWIRRQGPGLYRGLKEKGDMLREEITRRTEGLNVQVNGIGSMFQVFFTNREVSDYASARTGNVGLYASFFRTLLESGIFVPPSQFETCFLSAAHTSEDLEMTSNTICNALKATAE